MCADEADGPADRGPADDWLAVDAVVVERGFEARLRAGPGEVVAVLGPNGSGKSTLLSVIAGLVRPDAGRVRAGDRVLLDTRAGTDVPVADRRVGLLAQDALLFASLSVAENVEFGPRSQGVGKAESAAIARRELEEVGAANLARRKPRKLSGGQEQRVAIARALAAGPRVLLLDEPMGSLDVAVAANVRSMLRRVLRERARSAREAGSARDAGSAKGAGGAGGANAAVIVTHDVVDALTLADRIVVLDNGVVVDEGPVDRVLRSPRSAFAADLAGTNMIRGRSVPVADSAPSRRTRGAVQGDVDASGSVDTSGSADTAGGPDGGEVGRGGGEAADAGRPRGGFGGLLGGRRGRRDARARGAQPDGSSRNAAVQSASGPAVRGGTLHTIDEGEPAVAVFSPRSVAVFRRAPDGSPRNVFPVEVAAVEARGDSIRVRGRGSAGEELMADMTIAAARELSLEAGAQAVFVVKASEVRVYPA